jgi:hypothetical protein
LKIIKKFLLGTVFVILVTGAALYLWLMNPFVNIPVVGRDLPSNIASARKIFKERVAHNYPIGTPAANLITDLQKQKFKLVISDKSNGDIGIATYDYSRLPCSYSLIIEWETDMRSNLSSVKGDRRLSCL